jgi:hypothetical protein
VNRKENSKGSKKGNTGFGHKKSPYGQTIGGTGHTKSSSPVPTAKKSEFYGYKLAF